MASKNSLVKLLLGLKGRIILLVNVFYNGIVKKTYIRVCIMLIIINFACRFILYYNKKTW